MGLALTKLSVKNFRIFRDFGWSAILLPFSKKNLIYGWNGTGKSTLTEIFRSLEKKQNLTGNITLSFGDRSVAGSNIASELALPQVRVFNKTYVEENIFTPEKRAASIFYLGEESIEKQKEIESHRKEIIDIDKRYSQVKAENDKHLNELDKFCQDKANNSIKPTLRSNGTNSYNTYNKGNFKTKAETLVQLIPEELQKKILSDEEYQVKLKQTTSNPKNNISLLAPLSLDVDALKKLASDLLEETVTSQVIQELESNANLSSWVKAGIELHRIDHGFRNECAFCKNELIESRVKEIEGHFNDAYNSFITKIEKNINAITQRVISFQSFQAPDKSALYDSFLVQYETALSAHSEQLKSAIIRLTSIKNELEEKKKSPFKKLELQSSSGVIDVSVTELNRIIEKNNSETTSFNQLVSSARLAIEEHIVASSVADYNGKKEAIASSAKEMSDLVTKKNELTNKIALLERSVREDLKPAEELNRDIQSYLGRDELKFTVKDNGYELTRANVVAENLSEGEKTAIAFLHFLKSLSDKNFDIKSGIVVIDDPISSLDSNSIYHAFGFMKERTNNAGQLFILTHNHTFFRQVKNWFNHLKGSEKKTGRFYMIQSKI